MEDHKDDRVLSISVMLYESHDILDLNNSNECKANAILISKSLEMLEMLENVVIHFNELGVYPEFSKQIKKLIKEATNL